MENVSFHSTRLLAAAVAFALLTLAVVDGRAATWRVAQDGSGDFEDLFAVADAVASGDTVLIAAGVYDSTGSFVGASGDRTTCFPIRVKELTVIGSDRDGVLIGPAEAGQSTTSGPYGFYSAAENSQLHLSSITLRNNWTGVNTRAAGRIESVRFYQNEFGVWGSGSDGLDVSSCIFEQNGSGYLAVGTSNPQVTGCTFIGGQGPSINFIGAVGGTVLDCTFPSGRGAIQFEQGATSGIVRNCNFGVLESVSLSLVAFSSAQVTDCIMMGASIGVPVHVEQFSSLLMTQCHIGEGASGWSIDTRSPVTLEIRQCDILPGNGFAIKLGSGAIEPSIINMPLNYWGTIDPQQIQDLIWDANDDSTTMATVIYEPFAHQSVSNEEESVGGLKALFRRQQ